MFVIGVINSIESEVALAAPISSTECCSASHVLAVEILDPPHDVDLRPVESVKLEARKIFGREELRGAGRTGRNCDFAERIIPILSLIRPFHRQSVETP